MPTSKKYALCRRNCRRAIVGAVIASAYAGLGVRAGYAASSTWSTTAASTDWLAPTNWSPQTVPNASTDTATFGSSTQTTVNNTQTSSALLLAGITFNAGASAYTITGVAGASFTISGAGVVNNSGITQNFTVPITGSSLGQISFSGSASAANSLVTYTNNPNAFTQFFVTSTAGGGTSVNNGGASASASGGGTLFSDSASGGTGAFINNGATASNAAAGGLTSFSGTSMAGSGTYTQNGAAVLSGTILAGQVDFANTASAENGTFINNPASLGSVSGNSPSGGFVLFTNSSTAGNAVISNNGATVAGTLGTKTYFFNTSTAGNATITNYGAVLTVDDSPGFGAGSTVFTASSMAGTATVITNGGGGGLRGSGGGTSFDTNASADHGTFIVNGASISGGSGGHLSFSGNSTAANGAFTANGATASGSEGGTILFSGTTGANAVFTINGGNFSGGLLEFQGNSTAGSAAITTNGSPSAAGGSGETLFFDTSSAGNATLINNAGTAASATGAQIIFIQTSTANNASFTNNGATTSGALGGSTTFGGNSTADNATLIANAGTNGGGGGKIIFRDDSQFTPGATAHGGTSRIEVFGNGSLDISRPNNITGGITVGSIEGDGNVFLGGQNSTLSVGISNATTTFAGSIQDGGANNTGSSGGGNLTKIGSGTLTLSGASTFTGQTTINAGKLVITGSTSSDIVVNSGGTLGGSGTINAFVWNRGGIVAPGDPVTLNVNQDYEQDAGATLRIVIDGPGSFDKLAITGRLFLEGGAILELDFVNGFAPTTGEHFNFMTVAGTVFIDSDYTGNFSQVNIVGLEPGFQFNVAQDGTGNFGLQALNDGVSTSVPEPASLALLGIAGIGLMISRRSPRRPQ